MASSSDPESKFPYQPIPYQDSNYEFLSLENTYLMGMAVKDSQLLAIPEWKRAVYRALARKSRALRVMGLKPVKEVAEDGSIVPADSIPRAIDRRGVLYDLSHEGNRLRFGEIMGFERKALDESLNIKRLEDAAEFNFSNYLWHAIDAKPGCLVVTLNSKVAPDKEKVADLALIRRAHLFNKKFKAFALQSKDSAYPVFLFDLSTLPAREYFAEIMQLGLLQKETLYKILGAPISPEVDASQKTHKPALPAKPDYNPDHYCFDTDVTKPGRILMMVKDSVPAQKAAEVYDELLEKAIELRAHRINRIEMPEGFQKGTVKVEPNGEVKKIPTGDLRPAILFAIPTLAAQKKFEEIMGVDLAKLNIDLRLGKDGPGRSV